MWKVPLNTAQIRPRGPRTGAQLARTTMFGHRSRARRGGRTLRRPHERFPALPGHSLTAHHPALVAQPHALRHLARSTLLEPPADLLKHLELNVG
jgi:hypothetical protein